MIHYMLSWGIFSITLVSVLSMYWHEFGPKYKSQLFQTYTLHA